MIQARIGSVELYISFDSSKSFMHFCMMLTVHKHWARRHLGWTGAQWKLKLWVAFQILFFEGKINKKLRIKKRIKAETSFFFLKKTVKH